MKLSDLRLQAEALYLADRQLYDQCGKGWEHQPLWKEFLSASQVYVQRIRALSPHLRADDYSMACDVQRYYWMSRWHEVGQPVFELSHGIASAFALTNPDNVRCSEIAPPFDFFCVQLPYPRSPVVLTGKDGSPVDANLIAFARFPCAEGIDFLLGPREPSSWRMRVGILTMVMTPGQLFATDMLYYASTDETFSPASRRPNNGEGLKTSAKDLCALDVARSIAINMSLYLSATSTNRAGHAPAVHASAKAFPPVKRVLLGRDVKIAPQIVDAARALSLRGVDERGWKLHARFLVRGHWRNQACGTARSERQRIWIAPYWKGPENATDAIAGIYHIKEKSDEA